MWSNGNKNGAVSNFQVKNKDFFFFFQFWGLIQEKKVYYFVKSRDKMCSSYTCICSCGTSFPRSTVTWSWSNNYLRIVFIISFPFVNQIVSVHLNYCLKKVRYIILSCLQLLISLFVSWLVSETFPKGGILLANPQICWTSETWSQFKNEFTFLLHLRYFWYFSASFPTKVWTLVLTWDT